MECGCCFGDFTFEDMDSCTAGHLFCKGCITKHVTSSLYGQATNPEVFRCIWISGICSGHFSEPILRRALPRNVFLGYERTSNERVAGSFEGDSLFTPLKCPFCPYTEYTERHHLDTWWSDTSGVRQKAHPVRRTTNSLCTFLLHATYFSLLILYPHFIPEASMGPTAGFLFPLVDPPGAIRVISRHIHRLLASAKRDRNVFYCRNVPEPSSDPSLPPKQDPSKCGRRSCLLCLKEWHGPDHECHTDADDLRLYVERAMAEAVKRTCPKCRTSFVKLDGCNSMHCSCGYHMCYICREDISKTGYSHFCQHFRFVPGVQCRECAKCDLWKAENDEVAAIAAADRAREEWMRNRSTAGDASRHDSLHLPARPHSSLLDQLVMVLLG
jgi:hypothetical protein